MQVSELMTRPVECVRPGDTLKAAARKMRDLNIGPLPVCGEEDRLVGMLTDRDLAVRAVAEGWDPKRKHVSDAMSEGIVYCFEDQDVDEAAQLMREHQIRRLIVLNRDRRLVGIVSLGDLAVETGNEHLAGRTLEEISEPSVPNR
jgi:CBS domain-containing protein